MIGINVPICLECIIERAITAVVFTEHREQAGTLRPLHQIPLYRRVKRAKEDQLVLYDWSTKVDARIVRFLMQQLSNLIDAGCIALFSRCLKRAGPAIAVDRAVVIIAARLRDDIHHATLRLTILGLKAGRLYLDLFDKGRRDARAQSAIGTGKRSYSTEC